MKQNHNKILLLAFLFFLLIYNFTNIGIWWPMLSSFGHLIFNWPDATANYFFADIFATTNSFSYFEPLNTISDNLIHGRSFNVIDGNLVPITFLPAVLIFGAAFRILGEFGILAFTPILAALSGFFVYRIVYYVFKDRDLSLISAILFWSLAPIVFFANVVMLPNILFVFLVLAGWYAISKSLIMNKNFYWILGSLFLSLAVFVRPIEIVWLSLISIFIIFLNRKKINWQRYLYGILIFSSVAFLFLAINKATYGAFLTTGYTDFQSGQVASEVLTPNYIKLLFIPFGFDPVLIAKNFYKYFVDIVAPHFLLAILAISILFYKKQIKGAWKKYLIISPFIFLLILIYYASWDLADPLVKELNKISISYVRYFLPLYIWILPLTALAIKQIFFGPSKINRWSYYIVMLALIISSLKLAFYSKNDGLWKNYDNLQSYYNQYQKVEQIAPEDSIIISDRSDKLFFPKYKVVVFQGELPLWPRIANLIEERDVYYYSNLSTENMTLVTDEAAKSNLFFDDGIEIENNFKLYKIKN